MDMLTTQPTPQYFCACGRHLWHDPDEAAAGNLYYASRIDVNHYLGGERTEHDVLTNEGRRVCAGSHPYGFVQYQSDADQPNPT